VKNDFRASPLRPWRVIVAAVGGLLLAIAVAGGLALAITRNVTDLATSALEYDVELEDRADDLRVAVLDMRHFHRNIVFGGASRRGIENFDTAFDTLTERIADLAAIGVRAISAPQPAEVAWLARDYQARVRPAFELYGSDRAAFDRASDAGLALLERLEEDAIALDRLGEELASASLARVHAEAERATLLLSATVLGLGVIGAALAFAVIRFLGELRALYSAQQAAAERLGRALQAKNDFVADASHELRTPLTVLRGSAEVALTAGPDGSHVDVLREIVNEAARMSRLVDDMLLLARSDAGSLDLAVERVDLEPLLAEIAARARVLARERGAELEADLRAAGSARVDPGRLAQAVLNLVDNAAKYGQRNGRVRLRAVREDGELVVEVADDGPGIAPEELPLIFERFYRVDKTRARRLGGAGLGLAIAKTIVEAHRGLVDVRSSAAGTTFRLALPAQT